MRRHDTASILAAYETRLKNTVEQEIDAALAQVFERVSDLVQRTLDLVHLLAELLHLPAQLHHVTADEQRALE